MSTFNGANLPHYKKGLLDGAVLVGLLYGTLGFTTNAIEGPAILTVGASVFYIVLSVLYLAKVLINWVRLKKEY